MKNKFFNIGLGLLLLIISNIACGQQNIQAIDLETVLMLGGANNLTIKRHKFMQELAIAELEKAKEWWLPDIYAGTAINKLWGTTMNSDGRFYTDVNSQNFWAGIGFNASWDFGKGVFKVKSKNLQAQATQYSTDAQRNKTLMEIIEVYYDFLSAQLYYKAYAQLAGYTETITLQLQIQVEAGIRYESDLLLSQSNQNHIKVEMLQAKMNFTKKSAALVKLLNLAPNVKLVSTDSLLTPLDLVEQMQDAELNDLIYNNRPEFKAGQLILKSLQAEKRTTTTGLWFPGLKLGTYTSMFGDVFSPLYPTSTIVASLMWKIPLGRFTHGGELAQFNAKISIQKTELEEIKAMVNEEIISSRETMYIAHEQMKIAVEGAKQAKKALIQGMERQRLGTVLPFEILQTQEVYIKSRLDYLNAVSTYNKAQYKLFIALGNDL